MYVGQCPHIGMTWTFLKRGNNKMCYHVHACIARSPRVFTAYPKLCNPKTLNIKIIIMKKNFVRL